MEDDMKKLQADMKNWGNSLLKFHLPRWEELPTLELYMDQVITLIDQYLSPVIQTEKHPLLTSSMVNNYVKKGMIPAPEKKRYNQKHLAFLIAITMLKQVLTIPEIKASFFKGKLSESEMPIMYFVKNKKKQSILLAKKQWESPSKWHRNQSRLN